MDNNDHNSSSVDVETVGVEEFQAYPKRASRRLISIKIGTAAFMVMVPLFLAMFILPATSIRLRGEARRVVHTKAHVAARWMADRLNRMPPTKRGDQLAKMGEKLNASVGLFDSEGTRIAEIDSSSLLAHLAPKEILAATVLKNDEHEFILNKKKTALAVANLNATKNAKSVWVVVALPVDDVDSGAFYILIKLLLVATLMMGVAVVFGYSFGLSVSEYMARLGERLGAMIEVKGPPPKISNEEINHKINDLDRSALELESRFRGELALYRDALEEVQVLDSERTTFLGEVAGDLRIPLLAILEQAGAICAGKFGEMTDAQMEDLKIIEQAGERLLEMVEEVLDLSSLNADGIEYDSEPISLLEVAKEVVREARVQVSEKQLEVILEVDSDDLPKVKGSRRRIWQVITNLVSNSIKFTDIGEVKVSVCRIEGNPSIQVYDTGVGIPESEREAIFDPFKQSGEVSKRKRGVGLGLAICKRLMELHGGSIRVSSTLGKGSEFTVIFDEGDRS